MNLTKSVKQLIVDRFLGGAAVAECAMWYGLKEKQVEGALREELHKAFARELESIPVSMREQGDSNGTSEKT